MIWKWCHFTDWGATATCHELSTVSVISVPIIPNTTLEQPPFWLTFLKSVCLCVSHPLQQEGSGIPTERSNGSCALLSHRDWMLSALSLHTTLGWTKETTFNITKECQQSSGLKRQHLTGNIQKAKNISIVGQQRQTRRCHCWEMCTHRQMQMFS